MFIWKKKTKLCINNFFNSKCWFDGSNFYLTGNSLPIFPNEYANAQSPEPCSWYCLRRVVWKLSAGHTSWDGTNFHVNMFIILIITMSIMRFNCSYVTIKGLQSKINRSFRPSFACYNSIFAVWIIRRNEILWRSGTIYLMNHYCTVFTRQRSCKIKIIIYSANANKQLFRLQSTFFFLVISFLNRLWSFVYSTTNG